MKKIALIITVLAVTVGLSLNAWASPFTPVDDNDGNPDIYDAINTLLGTSYTGNDEVDDRRTNWDQWWETLYGDSPVMLLGLTAAHRNTLGFYTDLGTGQDKTEIFGPVSGFGPTGSGTASDPFWNGGYISTDEVFGFYLESERFSSRERDWVPNETFYSEEALNPYGFDHMYTYDLWDLNGKTFHFNPGGDASATQSVLIESAYLIGWEDIIGGGDRDWDDTMFLVAQVEPVPEPGTILLLGAGLAGLGIAGRRRARK